MKLIGSPWPRQGLNSNRELSFVSSSGPCGHVLTTRRCCDLSDCDHSDCPHPWLQCLPTAFPDTSFQHQTQNHRLAVLRFPKSHPHGSSQWCERVWKLFNLTLRIPVESSTLKRKYVVQNNGPSYHFFSSFYFHYNKILYFIQISQSFGYMSLTVNHLK